MVVKSKSGMSADPDSYMPRDAMAITPSISSRRQGDKFCPKRWSSYIRMSKAECRTRSWWP